MNLMIHGACGYCLVLDSHISSASKRDLQLGKVSRSSCPCEHMLTAKLSLGHPDGG